MVSRRVPDSLGLLQEGSDHSKFLFIFGWDLPPVEVLAKERLHSLSRLGGGSEILHTLALLLRWPKLVGYLSTSPRLAITQAKAPAVICSGETDRRILPLQLTQSVFSSLSRNPLGGRIVPGKSNARILSAREA